MASSGRPPFPRDGWSAPELEQKEAERTRQRLHLAEGKDPEQLQDRPRLGFPAEKPELSVLLYGAPPLRRRSRLSSFLLLPLVGALLGLILGRHLAGSTVLWSAAGSGLGLLVVVLVGRLQDR